MHQRLCSFNRSYDETIGIGINAQVSATGLKNLFMACRKHIKKVTE
jgi:hypothetical protein